MTPQTTRTALQINESQSQKSHW